MNGAPERFVPDEMRGELIEAEHIGRYRWAAPLVAGRAVVDAGCGTAYGSAILAEAGAISVDGVDAAEDVLRAVEPLMPDGVKLTVADIQQLPFDDGVFDAVVCFEVLEHLDDAERAVKEFARVLVKGGFVVVSSPNRTVYPAGNPHHKHEFLPEELRLLLHQHFEFVDLYRQQAWLASAVLKERDYVSEGADLTEARLHKVVRAELGTELYTVAVAGSAPLPLAPSAAVLTSRPGTPLTVDHALRKPVAPDGGVDEEEQIKGRQREEAALRHRISDVEARLHDASNRETKLERHAAELRERARELDARLRDAHEQIKGRQREDAALRDQMSKLEARLRDANNREKKLERHAADLHERQGELEARLRDANDQMLRRDEELQRAYAAETSHAVELQEEIARLDRLVQLRDAQIRELDDVIKAMHATRVWRFGSAYWGARDRLRLGRLRGRR
jgi:2-polyprenyl-3-methyl-5-hydroxy-6-metoxy-1,4-benzoquinol methylase/predicted transcriptional regulator